MPCTYGPRDCGIAGLRERIDDGWTIRNVLATARKAPPQIDFHHQVLTDQTMADTEPAARLEVLREGKAVRKAMLTELERVL